jgi:rhodanese-related sulfurtransferase
VTGTFVNFIVDNWPLILAALTSGGLLIWPLVNKGGGPNAVATTEAVRLINREKGVLVDVSEAAEYAAGHAIGAKSVPAGELQGSKLLPINKTLPIVLICPTGSRAGKAAAQLRALGYDKAVAVAGGLAAWREAQLPIEKAG